MQSTNIVLLSLISMGFQIKIVKQSRAASDDKVTPREAVASVGYVDGKLTRIESAVIAREIVQNDYGMVSTFSADKFLTPGTSCDPTIRHGESVDIHSHQPRPRQRHGRNCRFCGSSHFSFRLFCKRKADKKAAERLTT
ncbi:hypothetical protein KBI23_08700 [bacterium]|nr:hypothetical protein [bacterium]MBP9810635.1 hypothetical protein [bacterium]